MLKFGELEKLSLEDVNLILADQQDLYSREELDEIEEYRECLIEQARKTQGYEKQRRRIVTICPKCDGLNDSQNTKCIYCNHRLEDGEYYVLKNASEEGRGDTIGLKKPPTGRLLFGLLFSGGGVGAITYGCILNNSVEAQLNSMLHSGSTDPGTNWIILGAAAAVLGVVMLTSAFLNKE